MYPFKFNPILKSTIWGGEKIIPFKPGGAQQMAVGVEGGYYEKQGHAGIQEDGIPIEVFPVFEKEPEINRRNVGKPEKIGYDKIFTKRDVIVQRKVNHMVRQSGPLF